MSTFTAICQCCCLRCILFFDLVYLCLRLCCCVGIFILKKVGFIRAHCCIYPRRLHSRRRGYSIQSRLSVCLFVRALKGKRFELSIPNFVHIYSIAVARHALTQRSKGQRSRSHSYENRHGARLLVTMARIPHTHTPLCYLRPLAAWVCMSIRLPMFPSYYL